MVLRTLVEVAADIEPTVVCRKCVLSGFADGHQVHLNDAVIAEGRVQDAWLGSGCGDEGEEEEQGRGTFHA